MAFLTTSEAFKIGLIRPSQVHLGFSSLLAPAPRFFVPFFGAPITFYLDFRLTFVLSFLLTLSFSFLRSYRCNYLHLLSRHRLQTRKSFTSQDELLFRDNLAQKRSVYTIQIHFIFIKCIEITKSCPKQKWIKHSLNLPTCFLL